MLALMHYLPYLLLAGLIGFFVLIFSGGGDRKTDYRRLPRQQYYRWNDNGAHRER